MKPVRAVLFDLDHTLFDTNRTERHALSVIAKGQSLPFKPAIETYRVINAHVWSEYRAGRITSKELRVLRFHLWLEKHERDPKPARDLARTYLSEFSSRGDLIAGAAAALRSLGKTGVRLGIVTNGIDRVQRSRLRAAELVSHFPVIVTSERAGITKPDPRILHLALDRLRVSPDEAVYVGDDLHIDGLAANRAAMRFVWFNPRKIAPPKGPRVCVDHEVTHLREIRPLIKPA